MIGFTATFKGLKVDKDGQATITLAFTRSLVDANELVLLVGQPVSVTIKEQQFGLTVVVAPETGEIIEEGATHYSQNIEYAEPR